jgi:hypothetical protein
MEQHRFSDSDQEWMTTTVITTLAACRPHLISDHGPLESLISFDLISLDLSD